MRGESNGRHITWATRILLQNGFKTKNISGGMLCRAMRGLAELK